MAGEWLKFDCTLPEKAETLAITAALGWDDPDLTVGKLMRLFRWFDQHTVDGNARGVTPALLDRIIGVSGFVQATADAGWIIIEGAEIRLSKFEKHNGTTAKARAQTAKRVAAHRATPSDQECNAGSVTPALAREEEEKSKSKEQASLRSASSSPSAKTPPDELAARKQERLRQITADAIEAYNAAVAKPTGVLPRVNPRVGRAKRERQVGRCVKVARDICREVLNSDRITPEFWAGYFEQIAEDDFKSGRQAPGKDHPNWKPGFEYLTREDVMLDVFDKSEAA